MKTPFCFCKSLIKFMNEEILQYYQSITKRWKLPKEVKLLYPFDNLDTLRVMGEFYTKYYKTDKARRIILGINPGRLGAGVTGIPFTDPKILEEKLKIKNPFQKRNELSSIYVYDLIQAYGGPAKFFKNFFISSVCPLGFTKNGINYNYYDDKELYQSVERYIVKYIQSQLNLPILRDVAFCWGKGKNYKFLKKLNDQHGWFEKIIPQPHPRWVMQYKLKMKEEILGEVLQELLLKNHN